MPPSMKFSSLLALSFGLIFGAATFGATSADASAVSVTAWQTAKITEDPAPIFPSKLLRIGVTRGKAQVTVSVDANGQLTDALVVEYTDPEFGTAAVTAIRQWRIIPARLRGEAVGTTFDFVFNFSASGVVVTTDSVDYFPTYMRSIFDGHSFQACTMQDLDRIPTPISTTIPAYPKQLAAQGIKGAVTIDFYIDQTGAVRMPTGSRDEDLRLSSLAIAAIRQWKFEPPMSHGRPALVRAKQLFNFN